MPKYKIYRKHRVVAPWLIRAICREDNKYQKYRPLKSKKQWEMENPEKVKDDGRIAPSEESESDEEIVYYKDVMEKLEAKAKESLPGFIDQTIFVRQMLREECKCPEEYKMCRVLQGDKRKWVTINYGCEYSQNFGRYFNVDMNANKPYFELIGSKVIQNYDL